MYMFDFIVTILKEELSKLPHMHDLQIGSLLYYQFIHEITVSFYI